MIRQATPRPTRAHRLLGCSALGFLVGALVGISVPPQHYPEAAIYGLLGALGFGLAMGVKLVLERRHERNLRPVVVREHSNCRVYVSGSRRAG